MPSNEQLLSLLNRAIPENKKQEDPLLAKLNAVMPPKTEPITFSSAVSGAANIADVGLQNTASAMFQGLAGIGGALQGADPVKSMEQGKSIVPEAQMSDDATNLIQQGQSVYDALPDSVKTGLSNIVNAGEISAETVFQATNSPFLATITRVIPDAIGLITGAKAFGKSVSTAVDAIPGQGAQAKGMQDIAQRLQSGDTSRELAPYTLEQPQIATSPKTLAAPEAQGQLMAPQQGSFATVKALAPRAKIDSRAKNALSEGWDSGIISGIENASPLDRKKYKGMLNIMEKVKKDPLDTEVWPTNIIGNSINQRLKPLFDQNAEAGERLKREAVRLRGQSIDYAPIEQGLMERLDNIGIEYNRDNKELSFTGSDIEMNTAAEKQVEKFINRILRVGNDDALAAHKLKKWIDSQVEYGKTAKDPMLASVQRIMTKTRTDINESLRTLSPEYKDANIKWSETRGAIDKLDELTPKRTDLEHGDTNEILGTLSRKLISLYASGSDMRAAFEGMEKTATKYGGKFEDSIGRQVRFNEELNRVLGAARRGSYQGQTEQATTKGMARSALSSVKRGAKAVAGKVRESRGQLEADELDAQIKAMRNYLESKK